MSTGALPGPLRHFAAELDELRSGGVPDMGQVGRLLVEGKIARLIYQSLYKQHQVALFGFFRVAFLTLANYLRYQAKPRLKLH